MNFTPRSRSSWLLTLFSHLAIGSLALGLAGSSVGCAGGDAPKTAVVHAGDMPEGESWQGVYYHPVFGYLHMVENGNTVVAKWQRSDKSRWGELSGTKIGNLLHFTWKEHTYGLVGPAAELHGKGIFVYRVEMSGDHKVGHLDGQFGLDQDEVGSKWDCIKQDRMEPKLDSITGDNTSTGAPAAAGNWDEK
jgi:hypothetical protein